PDLIVSSMESRSNGLSTFPLLDALPIWGEIATKHFGSDVTEGVRTVTEEPTIDLSKLSTVEDGKLIIGFEAGYPPMEYTDDSGLDRKSTRLNSSHVSTSYDVFCLKKQYK